MIKLNQTILLKKMKIRKKVINKSRIYSTWKDNVLNMKVN
jgi:hypothetical protein